MAVVTIDAQIGSGAPEVGVLVSRHLEIDYVDRLLMAEAAKRIGISIEAVEEKIHESPSLLGRITRAFRVLLERSAVAGTGGDPYFGAGWENLVVRPYEETEETEITSSQELNDRRFIKTYSEVIEDLASAGNVVIVGHGASVILRDHPGALRVSMVASHEDRTARIMEREGLDKTAAEKYTMAQEKARLFYFKRFFKVSANDPLLYHMILNMSAVKDTYAAELISRSASSVEMGGLG